MDLIVHLGDQFIAESFSDIHKKGGIKGRPFDIGTIPQKILQILFSVIWAMVSRSSRLNICLMITAPIKTLGFRAGLPVDLAELRLLNSLAGPKESENLAQPIGSRDPIRFRREFQIR